MHTLAPGTAFVYQVVMTWVLFMMMGATDLVLIEAVPNAMLAVTLAVMVTGTYFLYAGFFLYYHEMPPYLGWIIWAAPTSYAFTGTMNNLVEGSSYAYTLSNGTITALSSTVLYLRLLIFWM